MWILFLEENGGVSLQAVRIDITDIFELLGTTIDDWNPVGAFLLVDPDANTDSFPEHLAMEYLPMADTPQCYITYWMADDMPLQEIPVSFSDDVLDA